MLPHIVQLKSEFKGTETEWNEVLARAIYIISAGGDQTAVSSNENIADAAGKEPYGDVPYADSGFQKDGKKRYPVDTESHIRSAWNYIHKPHNAAKYSPEHLATIKRKIVSAWKSKIDKDGPPSA